MPSDDFSSLSPEEILEMQRKNCIFCKIIQGEIPSNEIYSDEKAYVILDINPASEGHCLILPKLHYQILPQIPDELIAYLTIVAKKISRALLKSTGVKGTTILIANGAIAGQKAPHFMIHVIPRKHNDLLFQLPKNPVDAKKLEEIKHKLASRLGTMMGKIGHSEKKSNTETKKVNEKEEEIDLDKIANLFD